VGVGSTADAHHMTAPHPDGTGAMEVMQMAIADVDAARRYRRDEGD